MARQRFLNHLSSVAEKVSDLLSPDETANKMAQPDGLIPAIIKSLPLGAAGMATGASPVLKVMLPILRDMVAQGTLKLPEGAISAEHFKPEYAKLVESALKGFLADKGQSGLGLASSEAIEIFKSLIDECGVDLNASKVDGLQLTTIRKDNGDDYEVILYFVELDSNGPKLPLIDNNREMAIFKLKEGFINWARKLRLDVARAIKQEEANLIVTGEHLGDATATLAKTDVGPPRGRQLRMVFNLSKSFDAKTFVACAAHEFGHTLGVCHEHVPMDDETLLMYRTNKGVTKPQAADLAAAVRECGWVLS